MKHDTIPKDCRVNDVEQENKERGGVGSMKQGMGRNSFKFSPHEREFKT